MPSRVLNKITTEQSFVGSFFSRSSHIMTIFLNPMFFFVTDEVTYNRECLGELHSLIVYSEVVFTNPWEGKIKSSHCTPLS